MEAFDLKKFREKHAKLSQRDFAAKVGVSQGSIGKIEASNGSIKVSNKLLDKIAGKFGYDVEPYKSYNQNKGDIHDDQAIEISSFEYKYYKVLEEKEALYHKLLELNDENRSLLKKIIDCTEQQNQLVIERDQLKAVLANRK